MKQTLSYAVLGVALLAAAFSPKTEAVSCDPSFTYSLALTNLHTLHPMFQCALLSFSDLGNGITALKNKIQDFTQKGLPVDDAKKSLAIIEKKSSITPESQLAEIKQFVNQGANINMTDSNEDTLLQYAVFYDLGLIFNYCIEKKADINAGRLKPLMTAVECNRVEFVKKLLEQPSIQVNFADRRGNTPLKIAEQLGNTEIVNLLKAKGAK